MRFFKFVSLNSAVAVLFNQRFMKSKKAATSNWANANLTESQLVYAANDAYAAIRVWEALGLCVWRELLKSVWLVIPVANAIHRCDRVIT
jgi:ribonuclease D